MTVSEMSLCRFEKLLLGAARELRPALTVSDPSVPFDRGHLPLFIAVQLHLSRPAEGVGRCSPGIHSPARWTPGVVDTFPERCRPRDA